MCFCAEVGRKISFKGGSDSFWLSSFAWGDLRRFSPGAKYMLMVASSGERFSSDSPMRSLEDYL